MTTETTVEYNVPISEPKARDVAEDLRLELNEVAQYGIGTVDPMGELSYDRDTFHYEMARLYVEWALDHVEEIDEDRHPYAPTTATDLRNIIFHLD
jgi:hypothetical protein